MDAEEIKRYLEREAERERRMPKVQGRPAEPWAMEERCAITPRGTAYVIAIQTGLLHRNAGKAEREAFNAFWDRVEAEIMRKGDHSCRGTSLRS